jgi:CHAD domain-containing protein
MRVATRRLRSALAAYRRLLDTDITEPVRAELRWLGGALGAARDAEVIREHLRKVVAAEPAELVLGPVADRVERTLDGRHDAAHRRLVADLTSTRYLRLLAALDRLPDAVGGPRADKPAAKVLVTEVRRAHRRMRRRLDDALGAPDGEADDLLHETRKAAKRVRYAAESASPALGSKADALAARMELAQETLGDHQDTVVIRAVLRAVASAADDDGEPSFTYGHLYAGEQQRGDRARAAFLELVDHHWARRPAWLR